MHAVTGNSALRLDGPTRKTGTTQRGLEHIQIGNSSLPNLASAMPTRCFPTRAEPVRMRHFAKKQEPAPFIVAAAAAAPVPARQDTGRS